MVEGQPPFNSKTGEEAADLTATDTRPSFKIGRVKQEPYVGACVELTRRCWAAAAARRPEASEICDELEAIMRQCPRPPAAARAAERALAKFGEEEPRADGGAAAQRGGSWFGRRLFSK